MKNGMKVLLFGACIALALAALPAGMPTRASGGNLIEGTFGSGPASLNPLTTNDTASNRVWGFMFPGLVGVNPDTQALVPSGPEYAGVLSESFEVTDNKVVTFKLRKDLKWSDGVGITAKDILHTWKVANDKDAGSPLAFYTGIIDTVEAPDDYTVVVTMKESNCNALSDASGLRVVPAHVFEGVAGANLKTHPFATAPSATYGIFNFQEFRSGERAVLVRNENYEKPAKLDGFIYNVVPDQTVLVERFLAGELNFIDTPPVNRRADVRAAAEKGTVKAYSFAGNSWDYLAMNYADPANPKNGLDDAGKAIDQGKHPVLGDMAVRRAIALALDVDSMVKGAVFGEGTRMAANLIPSSWAADPDLEPLPFDPDAAKKLLDDAGWKPGAGGIREKDGVRASVSLITNQGNTRREAIGTIVKDSLAQIGIEVDFQTIDSNVVLERMDAQTFDMIILGWRNGYPDDPDQTQLFGPASDVVGSGNNFTSYNNPKFNELMAKALSLPGCDQEERAKLYFEIQKIFQEDLPYVPLFVQNGMYAVSASMEGFDPRPSNWSWNLETWFVKTN